MRRRLLIGLGTLSVTVMLVVGLLFIPAVQTALVVWNLPEFPDWPEPVGSLGSEDEGVVYFATHSPFDLSVILAGQRGVETTGRGHLSFPDGASPEPLAAMVILPGSGGIKPGREHAYAEFLNRQGIAAFVLEYYAPRGLSEETNYLIRTGSVTEIDLVADAYSALAVLLTHPRIDRQRIGLLGFSYGGMATRIAMDARVRSSLAEGTGRFAVHVDAYGPCFQDIGSNPVTGAPLLTLRGTRDASNDLEACVRRESGLRQLGSEVAAIVYDGAGHAWENEETLHFSEDSPYISGCEWRYDTEGYPVLDGQRLVGYGPDASRATRISARLRLGARLKDCVQYGYWIGRNEPIRERAFADVAEFLALHLSPQSN